MLSDPHGNPLPGEKLLHLADSEGAKVKDARGQHGVGPAGEEHFGHVFECSGAAAGHHGYADGFTDAAGDDEVEPGFRAVGINGVQDNLPGTEGRGAFGPSVAWVP